MGADRLHPGPWRLADPSHIGGEVLTAADGTKLAYVDPIELFPDDRQVLAAAPLLWDAVLACRRHTHGLYLALTGHGEDAEARAWFAAYQALQAVLADVESDDGR